MQRSELIYSSLIFSLWNHSFVHNCSTFNMTSTVERFFEVRGNVQRVMFRQTVIRAMRKRDLTGGASNDRVDKTLVRLTLRGDGDTIETLVRDLRSGRELNDWGARATAVDEVERSHGIAADAHQVTTANVDGRNWNPNVTMYI